MIDEFDEKGPQQPAAITLSDPQIYSRETLVNDRRREAAYLEGLLEKSKTAVFEPQIRRDLRTLTSTVLQLGASFDPLAGRQATRGEALAEINQRIEETDRLRDLADARGKLIEAERRLEALIAAEETPASTPAASTADGEAEGSESESAAATGNADADETQPASDQQTPDAEEVEALEADLDRIKKWMDQLPNTQEVRQTAVGATPREVFRDRQAYRGELRGALSEVELDDAHDQGQNALYRLQFRATVLPGEHKDKMGVARLRLEPPELDGEDVLELYKTWLGHVTYRLNQAVGSGLHHDKSYRLLGMGLRNALFHSTCVPLTDDEQLHIALPPAVYVLWKRLSRGKVTKGVQDCKIDDWKVVEKRINKLLALIHAAEDDSGAIPALGCGCKPCGNPEWTAAVELLRDLSYVEPFMSASIRGLGDLGLIDSAAGARIDNLIDKVANGSDSLDRLRRILMIESRHCKDIDEGASAAKQVEMVPEAFTKVLVRECTDPRARCRTLTEGRNDEGVARGGADVYATAPVELAQQISTTASAFRSFEVAASLAASLPTSGVEVGAGLNRLRATRADLEGRERLPLVVGFAERQTWKRGETEEDPVFGWVFGPQASINAREKRLELRRSVVSFPVTADLSIPGWWPRIELELETAWVGNWHSGKVLEAGARTSRFPVYLPLNRADLDGLTEYLAGKTVGGALPYTSIAAVSPERIVTCANKVTLLVYGANVWRSSVAYLNGLAASEIRVLPDMAGLAATFEGIRALPQVPNAAGRAVLTVWTRNGAASKEIQVVDPKTAGLPCGAVSEPPLTLAVGNRPLLPAGAAKEARATLRIVEGKAPTRYASLGISVRPARPLAGGAMPAWSEPPTASAELEERAIVGKASLAPFQLRDGDALQASLVEIPVPGAEGKRHGVEGVFVYYATAAASQIRVATTELDKLPQPIVLILPFRYDRAYPDLRPGKATFGLKVKGAKKDAFRIFLTEPQPDELPPATADEAGRRLVLQLEAKKKDGSDLKGNEVAAFLAAGWTIAPTITGGDALPEVAGDVTSAKD